jgi:hypothetical protein
MKVREAVKKAFFTLVVGLGAVGFAGSASAQSSLPSSKATFAYSTLLALPGCASSAGCTDTDWHTVLASQIKMANAKDLLMNASLQCGIVTDTTVKSQNATATSSYDTAEARGTIRVRVKLTDPNGNVSYAQPSSGIDATGATTAGIVYCDRVQTLKAKFSGLSCTADLTTGAVTCASPEELELILKTLNANAFNFVAPNLLSGVYNVEVQARSSVATSTSGTGGSLASANAFVGAGSVSVESVRMIQGNTGTTLSF